MTVTTSSSRQFTQDASKAKKSAQRQPIFITDSGYTAHVLRTLSDDKKMSGQPTKIAELLAMPDATDIVFDAPSSNELARAAILA